MCTTLVQVEKEIQRNVVPQDAHINLNFISVLNVNVLVKLTHFGVFVRFLVV